jgi:8-oxo-dGTP pyrophosphatase MutT (NUDIX family)
MKVGRFMFGVGAVVRLANSGQILLLQRKGTRSNFNSNEWEFVYGRVDQHEGILAGLRRELLEEIGLTSFTIVRPLRLWRFYRGEPTDLNEIFGVTFLIEVNQQEITLSPEHIGYEWVSAEIATNRITVDGIREDLEAATSSLPMQLSDVDGG